MSKMTPEQAMRRAFSLGQTYWEQADSESWSKQDKAEGTRQKFEQLLQETLAQTPQVSAVSAFDPDVLENLPASVVTTTTAEPAIDAPDSKR